MTILSSITDFLFGCSHSNYSFPITVRKGQRRNVAAAGPTGTYVVCLGCGKEFPYDWRTMKVVPMPSAKTQPAPVEALESIAGKAS